MAVTNLLLLSVTRLQYKLQPFCFNSPAHLEHEQLLGESLKTIQARASETSSG